jgi:hypothetical protein
MMNMNRIKPISLTRLRLAKDGGREQGFFKLWREPAEAGKGRGRCPATNLTDDGRLSPFADEPACDASGDQDDEQLKEEEAEGVGEREGH